MYIRQQANEYVEEQADWFRQMAALKSEKQRDIDAVRREKDAAWSGSALVIGIRQKGRVQKGLEEFQIGHH